MLSMENTFCYKDISADSAGGKDGKRCMNIFKMGLRIIILKGNNEVLPFSELINVHVRSVIN